MSRKVWIPWTQPKLTSNSGAGAVSASNNGVNAWKALDGGTSGSNTSWETEKNVYPAWWMWKLPVSLRILRITLYNKNNATKVTKQVEVYADEGKTRQIGTVQTFAEGAFSTVTITPAEPVVTDTILVNCVNGYGNVFSGYYAGLGEVLITAEQPQTEYEVLFSDWDGRVLSNQFVPEGSFAAAPTVPPRAGYTFEGWDKDFISVTVDMTVTARYRPENSFLVIFKNYDGTVLKSQYVKSGTDAAPPRVPDRDGYNFIGWDKPYANVIQDTIITASYTEKVYHTVSFFDWDGAVLIAESIEHGKAATAPVIPKRQGYRFVGWSRSFSRVVADTAITAQYEELIYYTVAFKNHDGTLLKEEQVLKGFSASAPNAPNRNAYVFTGWDKGFNNVQSDLVVTALYAEACAVKFLDFDGTELKSEDVIKNAKAVPPLPPLRDGYIFEGWNKDVSCVTEDLTVTALYREKLKHTTINVYSPLGALVQTVDKVLSATIRDSLDGEKTLEFSTLSNRGAKIAVGCVAEFEGCCFNIVRVTKSISSGLMQTSAFCEHVSYILNDDCYAISELYFSGTPKDGLSAVLNGTPFTAGAVEFEASVDLKINTEVSRRAALMQLVAVLGGELECDGYKINILKHRGSTAVKALLDSKNVTDVAVTYEDRASVTSYELALHKTADCMVGDEVSIVFAPLGINTVTRIIALEYNPFYKYGIRVEVGDYAPTINDSLCQMQKESDAANEKLDAIEDELTDFEDEYSHFQADYDSFLNTYKEVTNISVADSSFAVSFSDGSSNNYSFTVDDTGRMTSITKVV